MIVRELRILVTKFKEQIACKHLDLLYRQKLGFSYSQVYTSRSQIFDEIIADALVKANDPLIETDKVRLPKWIDKETFSSFIAKINQSWG